MSEKVHDRLDSWKAIAQYLNRDATTVMRWAREGGLPVHSVPNTGQRRRTVYAYKGELDAWLHDSGGRGSLVWENSRDNELTQLKKAHAEEETERATPRGASVVINSGATPAAGDSGKWSTPQCAETSSAAALNALPSSPSPRPRSRRSLLVSLVGGGMLIALAAAAWVRVLPPEPKLLGLEQLTNDGFEKHADVVTDGARVYFREYTPTGCVVAEIPSTGGNPVAIARVDGDSFIQDISPDRSELLLIEGARLKPGFAWILPVLGGPSRRLGTIQAFSAAWSPDGVSLAYTTDDGLYLCDANGTNARRIVALAGKPEGVRWSPDGQRLCLRRRSFKEATLWEVGRDGKGLRRLVSDLDMPFEEPSCFWTPNGKYLILPGSYAGREAPWALRVSIGLLNRTAQVTRLGPAGVDLCPAAMSPDSSRLYCVGSTRVREEIERFDVRSKQFVPYLAEVPASQLDFTRNGQWVAFVDDHRRLWKCRSGGAEKVQLTLPPLEVQMPRWSPDGERIAFMGRDPGQPFKVRVISADGGSHGPLTSSDASEGAPTWSPDGSRLAFGELVSPADKGPGPLVIHVFDLKEHRLSDVPGSEGLWTARWSPAGRHIAALTQDSRSLMIFDFTTGEWSKLLTLGQIWDIHWSRTGSSIFLTDVPPEGGLALFQVRIPGHQPERLTGLGWESSTGWLGLAPDDSPLIARSVNGGEVYALDCRFP
jgi:Tol biopolymer transport system component